MVHRIFFHSTTNITEFKVYFCCCSAITPTQDDQLLHKWHMNQFALVALHQRCLMLFHLYQHCRSKASVIYAYWKSSIFHWEDEMMNEWDGPITFCTDIEVMKELKRQTDGVCKKASWMLKPGSLYFSPVLQMTFQKILIIYSEKGQVQAKKMSQHVDILMHGEL